MKFRTIYGIGPLRLVMWSTVGIVLVSDHIFSAERLVPFYLSLILIYLSVLLGLKMEEHTEATDANEES